MIRENLRHHQSGGCDRRPSTAGATAIGIQFLSAQPALYRAGAGGRNRRPPRGVRRVGVFVNETRERVEEIARMARLDVAQLHGDETPADYPAAYACGKPLRVGDGFDLAHYADRPGGSAAARWSGGRALRRRGQEFRLAPGARTRRGRSCWPAAWTPPTSPRPSSWRSPGAWMPARASKARPAKRITRK